MKELEEKLEGILEIHLYAEYGAVIDGMDNASEHIAKEVKDIAIDFYCTRLGIDRKADVFSLQNNKFMPLLELFDQFITERYKTK